MASCVSVVEQCFKYHRLNNDFPIDIPKSKIKISDHFRRMFSDLFLRNDSRLNILSQQSKDSEVLKALFQTLCTLKIMSGNVSIDWRSHQMQTSFSQRLYCVGGMKAKRLTAYSAVSYLNLLTNEWHVAAPIPKPGLYLSGTAVGSKIYTFGGQLPSCRCPSTTPDTYQMDYECCGQSVQILDCATNTWSELSSVLPVSRICSAVAQHGGFIYVTGGLHLNEWTGTCFRYCLSTGEWSQIKSMNVHRGCHRLVACGDFLYAIGGFNTSRVEQYNPLTDEWTVKARSAYRHESFDATLHDGRIYVSSYSGFEAYDPIGDMWTSLPQEMYHMSGTLVSVNGKLLSMGMVTDKIWPKRFFRQTYEYDFADRKWIQLADMDVHRINHFSVLVEY